MQYRLGQEQLVSNHRIPCWNVQCEIFSYIWRAWRENPKCFICNFLVLINVRKEGWTQSKKSSVFVITFTFKLCKWDDSELKVGKLWMAKHNKQKFKITSQMHKYKAWMNINNMFYRKVLKRRTWDQLYVK